MSDAYDGLLQRCPRLVFQYGSFVPESKARCDGTHSWAVHADSPGGPCVMNISVAVKGVQDSKGTFEAHLVLADGTTVQTLSGGLFTVSTNQSQPPTAQTMTTTLKYKKTSACSCPLMNGNRASVDVACAGGEQLQLRMVPGQPAVVWGYVCMCLGVVSCCGIPGCAAVCCPRTGLQHELVSETVGMGMGSKQPVVGKSIEKTAMDCGRKPLHGHVIEFSSDMKTDLRKDMITAVLFHGIAPMGYVE